MGTCRRVCFLECLFWKPRTGIPNLGEPPYSLIECSSRLVVPSCNSKSNHNGGLPQKCHIERYSSRAYDSKINTGAPILMITFIVPMHSLHSLAWNPFHRPMQEFLSKVFVGDPPQNVLLVSTSLPGAYMCYLFCKPKTQKHKNRGNRNYTLNRKP